MSRTRTKSGTVTSGAGLLALIKIARESESHTVSEDVDISGCVFEDRLDISAITFTKDFDASRAIFRRGLDAKKAEFQKGATFVECRSYGSLSFELANVGTNDNRYSYLEGKPVPLKAADTSIAGAILDFSRSIIRGRLNVKGCRVYGTLKAYGASVRNGIYAGTAVWQEGNDQGSAPRILRRSEFFSVNLVDLRTKGAVDFGGAFVHRDLRLIRARVQGSVFFRWWADCTEDLNNFVFRSQSEPDSFRTVVLGVADLHRIRVGGNVSFRGSRIGRGIQMIDASVGGLVTLRSFLPNEREEVGFEYSASSKLSEESLKGASDAHPIQTEIGSFGVRLEGSALGGVFDLQGASIAGNLDISGSSVHSVTGRPFKHLYTALQSLKADAAKITGDLSFPGAKIRGGITMSNATIGANVIFRSTKDQRTVIGEYAGLTGVLASIHASSISVNGFFAIGGCHATRGLNLLQAEIRGGFFAEIQDYSIGDTVNSRRTVVGTAVGPDNRKYSIRLSGANIGGNVSMQGGRFTSGVSLEGSRVQGDVDLGARVLPGNLVIRTKIGEGTTDFEHICKQDKTTERGDSVLGHADFSLLIENLVTPGKVSLQGVDFDSAIQATGLRCSDLLIAGVTIRKLNALCVHQSWVGKGHSRSGDEASIFLRSAEISGRVTVADTCCGSGIFASACVVGSDFAIHGTSHAGALVSLPKGRSAPPENLISDGLAFVGQGQNSLGSTSAVRLLYAKIRGALRIRAAVLQSGLNLQGAFIDGDLDLVEDNGPNGQVNRTHLGTGKRGTYPGVNYAVRMVNAHIGGDAKFSGINAAGKIQAQLATVRGRFVLGDLEARHISEFVKFHAHGISVGDELSLSHCFTPARVREPGGDTIAVDIDNATIGGNVQAFEFDFQNLDWTGKSASISKNLRIGIKDSKFKNLSKCCKLEFELIRVGGHTQIIGLETSGTLILRSAKIAGHLTFNRTYLDEGNATTTVGSIPGPMDISTSVHAPALEVGSYVDLGNATFTHGLNIPRSIIGGDFFVNNAGSDAEIREGNGAVNPQDKFSLSLEGASLGGQMILNEPRFRGKVVLDSAKVARNICVHAALEDGKGSLDTLKLFSFFSAQGLSCESFKLFAPGLMGGMWPDAYQFRSRHVFGIVVPVYFAVMAYLALKFNPTALIATSALYLATTYSIRMFHDVFNGKRPGIDSCKLSVSVLASAAGIGMLQQTIVPQSGWGLLTLLWSVILFIVATVFWRRVSTVKASLDKTVVAATIDNIDAFLALFSCVLLILASGAYRHMQNLPFSPVLFIWCAAGLSIVISASAGYSSRLGESMGYASRWRDARLFDFSASTCNSYEIGESLHLRTLTFAENWLAKLSHCIKCVSPLQPSGLWFSGGPSLLFGRSFGLLRAIAVFWGVALFWLLWVNFTLSVSIALVFVTFLFLSTLRARYSHPIADFLLLCKFDTGHYHFVEESLLKEGKVFDADVVSAQRNAIECASSRGLTGLVQILLHSTVRHGLSLSPLLFALVGALALGTNAFTARNALTPVESGISRKFEPGSIQVVPDSKFWAGSSEVQWEVWIGGLFPFVQSPRRNMASGFRAARDSMLPFDFSDRDLEPNSESYATLMQDVSGQVRRYNRPLAPKSARQELQTAVARLPMTNADLGVALRLASWIIVPMLIAGAYRSMKRLAQAASG